jgi:hypothetical protein
VERGHGERVGVGDLALGSHRSSTAVVAEEDGGYLGEVAGADHGSVDDRIGDRLGAGLVEQQRQEAEASSTVVTAAVARQHPRRHRSLRMRLPRATAMGVNTGYSRCAQCGN